MLGWCPGAVEVAGNIDTASAFFIEFFGTLFLVLTVLSTTNIERKQAASYLQPLSIGIAIFVLHMFLVGRLSYMRVIKIDALLVLVNFVTSI